MICREREREREERSACYQVNVIEHFLDTYKTFTPTIDVRSSIQRLSSSPEDSFIIQEDLNIRARKSSSSSFSIII